MVGGERVVNFFCSRKTHSASHCGIRKHHVSFGIKKKLQEMYSDTVLKRQHTVVKQMTTDQEVGGSTPSGCATDRAGWQRYLVFPVNPRGENLGKITGKILSVGLFKLLFLHCCHDLKHLYPRWAVFLVFIDHVANSIAHIDHRSVEAAMCHVGNGLHFLVGSLVKSERQELGLFVGGFFWSWHCFLVARIVNNSSSYLMCVKLVQDGISRAYPRYAMVSYVTKCGKMVLQRGKSHLKIANMSMRDVNVISLAEAKKILGFASHKSVYKLAEKGLLTPLSNEVYAYKKWDRAEVEKVAELRRKGWA